MSWTPSYIELMKPFENNIPNMEHPLLIPYHIGSSVYIIPKDKDGLEAWKEPYIERLLVEEDEDLISLFDDSKEMPVKTVTRNDNSNIQKHSNHNDDDEPRHMITLPLEIIQTILRYLHKDSDLLSLACSCKRLKVAISDIVWSERCEDRFDVVIADPKSPEELIRQRRHVYAARGLLTRYPTVFNEYELLKQPLSILRDTLRTLHRLIVKSNGEQGGKNFQFLIKCLAGPDTKIDLLQHLFRLNIEEDQYPIQDNRNLQLGSAMQQAATISAYAKATQLVLSHLIINPEFCTGQVTLQEYKTSQWNVYQQSNNVSMFIETTSVPRILINFDILLHILNLFKFHMQRDQNDGKDACQILGSHVCLLPNDLETVRESHEDEYNLIFDSIPHYDPKWGYEGFQPTRSNFDESTFTLEEKTLHMTDFPFVEMPEEVAFSHPFPNPPATYPKIIPFHGKTTSSTMWYIIGQLHCLPYQAVNGGLFSGFQRIIWIRYRKENDGTPDWSNFYVYEGCVLPGGLMILGRTL